MYIEPHGDLILLHNIPLDDTYNHTWFFDDADKQYAHFTQSKYVLKKMTRMNYQRYDTGVIVVNGAKDGGLDINEMYDCNYIMFRNYKRNEQPEKKWFYAFVTSIEYVSANATKVYYKIDYMQTWIKEFIPKQCFVEREHSATDKIGDNIVKEDIEVDTNVIKNIDYSYRGYYEASLTNYGRPIIMAIFDPSFLGTITGSTGELKGLLLGSDGTTYDIAFFDYSIQALTNFAEIASVTQNKIAGVYVVPLWVKTLLDSKFGSDEGGNSNNKPERSNYSWNTHGGSDLTRPYFNVQPAFNDIDGHKPKNNKLYTYPYNYYTISVNDGTEIDFKYEFTGLINSEIGKSVPFDKGFGISGNRPYLYLYVQNYYGQEKNYRYLIEKNNLPCLSLQSEEFVVNGINIIASVIQSFVGIKGGTNATKALKQVGRKFINNFDVSALTSHYEGATPTLNNCSTGFIETQEFTCYCKQIPSYQAQIIDEFFTMFGYATNRVKEPNRNVRKYHTYVKTNACVAEGNVPADDMREICRQYDKGITFWNPKYEMGVYNHSDGNPTL